MVAAADLARELPDSPRLTPAERRAQIAAREAHAACGGSGPEPGDPVAALSPAE
ncbi:hypothetical protein ACU686_09095 [Yinghuangia aomiensis]